MDVPESARPWLTTWREALDVLHLPERSDMVCFGDGPVDTVEPTIISDAAGRTLWVGAPRPGRQHDQTKIKTEGIDDLLDHHPRVRMLVDAAYRGLRR
ncbi:hypothetical protein ACIG56_11950 [Nocardia fusca]|uniref:hypothetical protein n=1 Tax=Nocardia fusca TaxID=941183 RepID=UPI0037C800A9